jgi:DNA-directed RNA polymerase specialized sigma24 family protein
MTERSSGKLPAANAGEVEPGKTRSRTTDAPASAVRPAASPPEEAGKEPPTIDLEAKDANDVKAPPPDLATRRKRLSTHREWRVVTVRWLLKTFNKSKKRLTEQDAEDIFQTACVKALSTESWPAEESKTLSWLFTIALRTCYDHVNAEKRRAEVPIGEREFSVETHAAVHILDFEQFHDRTLEEHPEIADGAAMWGEVVKGETVKDIAAKTGKTTGRVYEEIRGAKAVFASGWYQIPAAAAVGFAIVLILIMFPRDKPNRVGANHEHAEPNAPLIALPSHPDPAYLRGQALELHRKKDYEGCLRFLNHARRIDPAGEKDPAVAAARQDAEARLEE